MQFFFLRYFGSRQIQNVQRHHASRCCAFSLSFQYPSSIIQSLSFCLGHLFPLFLSSIISLCRQLPLSMCPIHFFCLALIISIKNLLFFHLFQYFFIRSVFSPVDHLHPPPY